MLSESVVASEKEATPRVGPGKVPSLDLGSKVGARIESYNHKMEGHGSKLSQGSQQQTSGPRDNLTPSLQETERTMQRRRAAMDQQQSIQLATRVADSFSSMQPEKAVFNMCQRPTQVKNHGGARNKSTHFNGMHEQPKIVAMVESRARTPLKDEDMVRSNGGNR